jgi:hypothetical protein
MIYIILWILLGAFSTISFFVHINISLGLPTLRIKDLIYVIPFSLVGPVMILVFITFRIVHKFGNKYNKFLDKKIID